MNPTEQRYNILILTGKSGSGKTTIANHLFANGASLVTFGFTLRTFLDQFVAPPTGLRASHYQTQARNEWEIETGYKDRMIDIGAELICKDPDIFIRAAVETIQTLEKNRLIVVPDCRSHRELSALNRIGNTWVVEITRNGSKSRSTLDDQIKADHVYDNNRSLDHVIPDFAKILRSSY